ncbi:unnamed protein product [Clonostachys byssicola]|uniref:Quinate transporter n=1 Tax=Clonostachys byssicola TaxID=160290 RepID=A0A9N9Y1U6_9HYPO|nr:unnamed protein product [Clonostachys byssicola]
MAPSKTDKAGATAPSEVYNWRIYLLALCASMGSAMFGYDSAFIGGAMTLPSFQQRFGLDKLSGNPLASLKANTVSTFQAGCFFGAILCYWMTERFGRKITLIVCGVVFDIGVVFQLASSGRVGFIYAGRAITGLGVGASSLLVPVYISEWSPPAIRGRLIGIFEVFLQVFQVIGFWINYAVNIHEPTTDRQWHIPFAFQLVPGSLLVIAMITQPESPRWLIKAGRVHQASQVLSRIRQLPETHEYLAWEVQSIESQLEREGQTHTGALANVKAMIREMKAPGNRVRILLGVAIMFLQNLVGANAINYYSPSIFASVGFTGSSVGLLATGIYGLVKVVSTLIFITWIVDRVGRRPPLIYGSLGALVAMLYLGIYTKISNAFSGQAPRDAGAYVAITTIYVFGVFFCCSWNSVAWIFWFVCPYSLNALNSAEIFPMRIRSICLVITTCCQWLGQFVIVYSTPYMMEGIQWGTFIFFASSIVLGIIFSYFFIPETEGVSLEEMDILFSAPGSARQKRKAVEEVIAERREEAEGLAGAEDVQEIKHESTDAKHVESV